MAAGCRGACRALAEAERNASSDRAAGPPEADADLIQDWTPAGCGVPFFLTPARGTSMLPASVLSTGGVAIDTSGAPSGPVSRARQGGPM